MALSWATPWTATSSPAAPIRAKGKTRAGPDAIGERQVIEHHLHPYPGRIDKLDQGILRTDHLPGHDMDVACLSLYRHCQQFAPQNRTADLVPGLVQTGKVKTGVLDVLARHGIPHLLPSGELTFKLCDLAFQPVHLAPLGGSLHG